MSKFLSDFGRRLSSRKFLLTVSGGITLYANKQYAELAGVFAAYILAEGGHDVAVAVKSTRTAAQSAEDWAREQAALEAVHAEV